MPRKAGTTYCHFEVGVPVNNMFGLMNNTRLESFIFTWVFYFKPLFRQLTTASLVRPGGSPCLVCDPYFLVLHCMLRDWPTLRSSGGLQIHLWPLRVASDNGWIMNFHPRLGSDLWSDLHLGLVWNRVQSLFRLIVEINPSAGIKLLMLSDWLIIPLFCLACMNVTLCKQIGHHNRYTTNATDVGFVRVPYRSFDFIFAFFLIQLKVSNMHMIGYILTHSGF